MNFMKAMIALVLLAPFTAVADHWTSPGDVVNAAHELDDAATHFAQQVRREAGFSHLATDAIRLARSANRLHNQVERGADYQRVLHIWQQVQTDYFHLQSAFDQAHRSHHGHHLQRDFQRVSNAYSRLEWSMTRGSGGGGRQVWECKAVDAGWEEHFGGHRATGFDRFDAEQNALVDCQRHHGRCRISNCSVLR